MVWENALRAFSHTIHYLLASAAGARALRDAALYGIMARR